MKNRIIEDVIIGYYEDFDAIHNYRENFDGYVYEPRNHEVCAEIESIVYDDLIKQCKTDIMHFIIEDLSGMLDWNYITENLQDMYFAEPDHD